MMEPSTTAIESELTIFLSTAYPELFREYIFFIVAMLISCIIIPIFVVWIFNKYDRKLIQASSPCKAYTHRETTPLTLHITLEFMIPILAVRELFYCLHLTEHMELYTVALIVFCVFLLLLAVLAAVGLFKFRVFGLISVGAFLLCFAACKQYQNLMAVTADVRDRTQYTTIGQYTVYIVDDYIVTQSMAISFVVFATLTMLAIYYYKRRFLFMPGKLNVPSCEHCRQVISKGNNFCTCC